MGLEIESIEKHLSHPEFSASYSRKDREMAERLAKQTLVLLNAGKFEGLIPVGMTKGEVGDLVAAGQRKTRREFLRVIFGSHGLAQSKPDETGDSMRSGDSRVGLEHQSSGQGITRRQFLKGSAAVGLMLALFGGKRSKPARAEPNKLPSLELRPGSTLEQTSVRCLGGVHIITVPSFDLMLIRFYAQAAIEMAARSTGRLDSNALRWAFLEIKTKVERANKERNPNFDPYRLQLGDRILLPPEEFLKITSLSVPTQDMPIEVVVTHCGVPECPDAVVGWMHDNQPRTIRVHGFQGPGEALKRMEAGMSGTINTSWPDGRVRPVLRFKVVRKEIQPGNEYDYNAPGVLLAAENLEDARTISCAVPDGSKVCLLQIKLNLP